MPDFTDLSLATIALADPTTRPADLAAIAQAQPSLGAAVARHPNTYPALVEWIRTSAGFTTPPATAEPRGGHAVTADATPPPTSAGSRSKGSHPRVGPVVLAGTLGAVVVLVVGVALVLTGVLGLRPAPSVGLPRLEGGGFATPEAAAVAYLDGLRDQDLNAMMGAFAYESYVSNFDQAASITRTMEYSPVSLAWSCFFPVSVQVGYQACVAGRRGAIAMEITNTFAYWVSPHLWDVGATQPTQGDPGAWASAFAQQTKTDFANWLFTDMTDLKRVDPVEINSTYGTASNQKNVLAQAAIHGLGADTYADVAITFSLGATHYVFMPSAGQYHGRWYLLDLCGQLCYLEGVASWAGGVEVRS